jgi:hypothetical protein
MDQQHAWFYIALVRGSIYSDIDFWHATPLIQRKAAGTGNCEAAKAAAGNARQSEKIVRLFVSACCAAARISRSL